MGDWERQGSTIELTFCKFTAPDFPQLHRLSSSPPNDITHPTTPSLALSSSLSLSETFHKLQNTINAKINSIQQEMETASKITLCYKLKKKKWLRILKSTNKNTKINVEMIESNQTVIGSLMEPQFIQNIYIEK